MGTLWTRADVDADLYTVYVYNIDVSYPFETDGDTLLRSLPFTFRLNFGCS